MTYPSPPLQGSLAAASLGSNQPDVVRLVDCNLKQSQQQRHSQQQQAGEAKYKNDENVLVSVPAQYRSEST